MAISDFDELRHLHGNLSDAATTCLVRYFQILKTVKRELRSRFTADDFEELAEAVDRLFPLRSVGSDGTAIVEKLASRVSSECAVRLRAMSDVERIVFLDAVERTANVPKKVTRGASVMRFML